MGRLLTSLYVYRVIKKDPLKIKRVRDIVLSLTAATHQRVIPKAELDIYMYLSNRSGMRSSKYHHKFKLWTIKPSMSHWHNWDIQGPRCVKAAIISLYTHEQAVQWGEFCSTSRRVSVGFEVSCQASRVIRRSSGTAVSPRSEITLRHYSPSGLRSKTARAHLDVFDMKKKIVK